MKIFIFSMAMLLVATPAWSAELPCEGKLSALEEQGIHRGAFLQALKNSRSDQHPSRYVLMAHLGRKNEGELHVVDVQTGRVLHMKLQHGIPENKGDASNYKKEELTYFGGVTVEKSEQGFSLEASSPSLKSRMKGSQLKSATTLGKCGSGSLTSSGSASGLCLQAKDLETLQALFQTEEGAQERMFIYPTRNLDSYLRRSKLANDEPDVCKVLRKMPNPQASGSSSQGGVH